MTEQSSTPHYPVQSLLENITQTLTKLGLEFELENAIKRGLKNEIKFSISDNFVTDIAELNLSNQVKLQENFCQFYWCLCFSSILFYDKEFGKEEGEDNSEDLKLAFSAFEAGVGLLKNDKKIITPRHVFFDLPNPYNKSEHKYVGIANNVFCYGIAFILCHELAHFEYNHSWQGSIEEEETADSSAFWALYGSVSEEEKITAIIGIITALCAIIFLDNSIKGDDTHPDSDIRLENVLKIIDSDYDNYWGIACVCLKMWAFNYHLDDKLPNVTESETWQDYFKLILNSLEDLKQEN